MESEFLSLGTLSHNVSNGLADIFDLYLVTLRRVGGDRRPKLVCVVTGAARDSTDYLISDDMGELSPD